MVKYSDKCKDDSLKKCGNRDEEYDVEFEGEEVIEMGGTFGGYNLSPKNAGMEF